MKKKYNDTKAKYFHNGEVLANTLSLKLTTTSEHHLMIICHGQDIVCELKFMKKK